MLLSYMWIGLDGSLCGATIRASLRDANNGFLGMYECVKQNPSIMDYFYFAPFLHPKSQPFSPNMLFEKN